MSAYLYTPTKSDITLWEAWVRDSLPLHVKALQDDPELEAKTRIRWSAYYGNVPPPTSINPLVGEVLAQYILASREYAPEGFTGVLRGLLRILLQLPAVVTEETYGWILADYPAFLVRCESIIDRMHSAGLPNPGMYYDIEAELVTMYKARVLKKAGVGYDD